MLTQYIRAALHKAHYEYVVEDGCYFATVPGLNGLWADGKTLEATRDTLAEVIEDWVIAHLIDRVPVPEVDGVAVGPREESIGVPV